MQGKGWEMESDLEQGSSSPKSVIMDGQPHDYASDAKWTPFADVPHRQLSEAEMTCPRPFF